MKGVFVIVAFGFFIIAVNGCYTIVSNNVNGDVNQTTIINYPPPLPVVNPIILYPPPPLSNPPHPRPIIRHPEVPKDRGGSGDQVRDPLRNHGGRGNGERTADIVKRDGNNSGSRR